MGEESALDRYKFAVLAKRTVIALLPTHKKQLGCDGNEAGQAPDDTTTRRYEMFPASLPVLVTGLEKRGDIMAKMHLI